MADISDQIAHNLNLKLKIQFELEKQMFKKPELKTFVQKISIQKILNKILFTNQSFTEFYFFTK